MKLLKNNLTEYHHRILHLSHLFFYDREISKKKKKAKKKTYFVCSLCVGSICLYAEVYTALYASVIPMSHSLLLPSPLIITLSFSSFLCLPLSFPSSSLSFVALMCMYVCRGAVFLFLLFQWCTLSAYFIQFEVIEGTVFPVVFYDWFFL